MGPYRCPVMTFRIRARSNIKDSMTFLIAEAPSRCVYEQPCQGDPVDINAPARSLHRQRGHRVDLGSSWLPTSRRIGEAELTWGFPTRRRQKAGRVAAAIAMVTTGVEAKSWDPIQGHYSLPRAGRWNAETLCAQRSGLSTPAAGQGASSRSRARGRPKGRVDSKTVFLRPQAGSGALAGSGLRV